MLFVHGISRFSPLSSFDPSQGYRHAENQGVQDKSVTTPVEAMECQGNFGEGISNRCPKEYGLRTFHLNFIFQAFIVYNSCNYL